MRVITGSARGRRLGELKGMETRPTTDKVKESIFNCIQFDVEDARVLDLFAGTGQLGIEALSRGAKSALFVDKRADAVKLVRENLALCHLEENAQVICVTHLAQIAAMADNHLFIVKKQENNKTYTAVHTLTKDARVREIARIIGGDDITPLKLKMAEEMLSQPHES